MIKLFRRIRRKLVGEGNLPVRQADLKRYLIYAIGEVLLVMIGILLALQVNNWNNESARKTKELSILTEMNRNLELNVKQFSAEIEHQDSIIQNINIILDHIKNNIPNHDSLSSKYASIAWSEEFNTANSAFETLKAIGLDLISSDSLRENIIHLFNVRYLKISDVISKISSADYTILSQVYLRHIEYDIQGNGMVNDFERLKKDREFTNLLSNRRIWKVDIINAYKELIEESLQLSRMIDQELERRT